jgi:hypothetical protein
MRHAITTRYVGPTNHTGARIAATSPGRSLSVRYDHAADEAANHQSAAEALAKHLQWRGRWQGAHTPDGFVWVLLERCPSFVVDPDLEAP